VARDEARANHARVPGAQQVLARVDARHDCGRRGVLEECVNKKHTCHISYEILTVAVELFPYFCFCVHFQWRCGACLRDTLAI